MNFSRSYIHHLIKANEILGLQLLTEHNITFMNRLMEAIRTSISQGKFLEVKKEWLGK
tara:strand:- start:996 stop:1169 length:174 start_codon:yes stop_codon:yes gene_type:complete